MTDWGLLLVRFVHVLGAMVWFGGGLVFGYFVQPGLKRLPGRERYERLAAIGTRVGPLLGVAGALTTGFGVVLAHALFASWNPLTWWSAGGIQRAVALALVLSVLAMGVGGMHGATLRRLEKTLAGAWTQQTQAEADRALRRTGALTHVSLVLLLAILFIMIGTTAQIF